MTTSYSKKSNAKRAAIRELGPDAVEGIDFHLIETSAGWAWETGRRPRPEEGQPVPAEADAEPAIAADDVAIPEALSRTEGDAPKPGDDDPANNVLPHRQPKTQRTGTKQALLIAMLKQPEGATLAQMVAATGWQAHTVRGAMAGALKKKLGLAVTSEKADGGERVYRIAA